MFGKAFPIPMLICSGIILGLDLSSRSMFAEADTPTSKTLPIAAVLTLCAAENDVVRALWTKEIVGTGRKIGLAFTDDWRDKNVEAGPLPALFLRETANSLKENPVRLGLRLGSDLPIQEVNRFEGSELTAFQAIKRSQRPQVFYARDTQLHTAMFPDFAAAEPCVSCHNAHEDSPKRDWQLNDVMGATAWTYPRERVTIDELALIIGALRQGFKEAYGAYLGKAVTFSRQPEIGDKWPRDGYYLPTVDVFMEEVDDLIPTLDVLSVGD